MSSYRLGQRIEKEVHGRWNVGGGGMDTRRDVEVFDCRPDSNCLMEEPEGAEEGKGR